MDAEYTPAGSEGDKDLEPPAPGNVDAFIRHALARFKLAEESEQDNRKEALLDDKFRNLEQWDPSIKAERDKAGRPALTVDKLNHPIRQVLNAQRQARPSIKVNPKGSGPRNQETASIVRGLIRQIEQDSHAEDAYDWAFDCAASSGIGYFRIITEWADAPEGDLEAMFDQEIKIRKILNKYSVYPDPTAQLPDKSDARFYFITEDVPIEEYKRLWPKSKLAQANGLTGLGDDQKAWCSEKTIRIAEYWYTEPKPPQTVLALEGGKSVTVDADPKAYGKGKKYNGIPILNCRDIDARIVKIAKINCCEILEGNDDLSAGELWPGQYIPIVPVIGEELVVDGKRVYRGMIRAARDSQRMANYQASELVRTLAVWGRIPWVGAVGQFKGLEKKWGSANIEDYPYLEYNPVDINNHLTPPPSRNGQEPPIQAIVVGYQASVDDIKASMGFFDASLGNVNPKDRSGRAILALQQQGELGSSNFQDNLRRSMTFAGTILVDLIPKVITRQGRIVTVLGEQDNKPNAVMFNQPFIPGETPQPINGLDNAPITDPSHALVPQQAKFYDIKNAKFSVAITIGRSHATKRIEMKEGIGELMQNEAIAPALAAPYVRAQDWDGAEEMADRLDRAFPQFVKKDGEREIPPDVQAYIAQLEQQHQQLTVIVNELTKTIETKQMELASKEKIAGIQAETQLAVAELKAELDRIKAVVQTVENEQQRVHDTAEAGRERAHARENLEFQAHQARAEQFTDQAHQRGMAAEERATAMIDRASQPPPQPSGNGARA
jgi:hypothetical protein